MSRSTDRIAFFSNLVEQDPGNPLHRFALAQAQLDAEDWAAAEATYAVCLDLDQGWMMAAIRRGRCLIELSRWAEARQALELGAGLAEKQGHEEPFEEIRALLDGIPDDA